MAKQYTAQEMRKVADDLDSVYVAPECEDKKEQYGYLSIARMMLLHAADDLERKEKREKKYEFALRTPTGWIDEEATQNTLEDIKLFCEDGNTIVRRSVGEWEDVK